MINAKAGESKNSLAFLLHHNITRPGSSPEGRSIEALDYGYAFLEVAGFLDIDIVLQLVAAFAQAVYVEDVAGVAGGGVE